MIKKSIKVPPMQIYFYRAEYSNDIFQFLALPQIHLLRKILIVPDSTHPDIGVEIETNLSHQEITTALALVEDGHVMLDDQMQWNVPDLKRRN
ncbi:hypothetical protein QN375_02915 [Pseudomonas sp. MH9.2]|uniref:hypothetical protein n=1 Tax=Pseudomonas sp. MH9.2 TaxID=3048629 RepID=UPI002AC92484|nr:hypothetical protein [Pseudomonas sp. MH9.2]MEB0024749.1 hypothetical protein [Pseudomonas sp. MH9.2]WPX70695.1 hypothetical protein RHM55_09130 [Pseudomonas sp. MH9.2]